MAGINVKDTIAKDEMEISTQVKEGEFYKPEPIKPQEPNRAAAGARRNELEYLVDELDNLMIRNGNDMPQAVRLQYNTLRVQMVKLIEVEHRLARRG